MTESGVKVQPITSAEAAAAAQFLHEHLNSKVSAAAWMRLFDPPWQRESPNSGFQLLHDGRVVGVYAAVYSERVIDGASLTVCNLAAFCVLEDFRAQGLRLIRPLLGQKGIEFTDLSPSGNVIAMNERLGFTRLDPGTRLSANLPALPRRGITLSAEPGQLESVLRDRDAEIYRDHRDAPAANHLLVREDDAYAYLVFRKDRRKGIPIFTTPLYAGGDARLLERAWASVASHLLLHHGLAVTLAESNILGFVPRGPGKMLAKPRVKMFRGTHLTAKNVDYLYSELALVRW